MRAALAWLAVAGVCGCGASQASGPPPIPAPPRFDPQSVSFVSPRPGGGDCFGACDSARLYRVVGGRLREIGPRLRLDLRWASLVVHGLSVYLLTPSQRVSLFGNGEFRVSDFARAYVQATYVQRDSNYLIAPEPFVTINASLVVDPTNPFNPAGVPLSNVQRRLTDRNLVRVRHLRDIRLTRLELSLVAVAFALLAGAALIETSQIAALQSLQHR